MGNCDCDNIIKEVDNFSTYKVVEERRSRFHSVTFNVDNKTMVCSCKKVEFVGIQHKYVVKVEDRRSSAF